MIPLKQYQQDAVNNALEIFNHASGLLDAAHDEISRANVVAYNGCLLIQAPTGAGKTIIAGHIAEEFSRQNNVVWFWFTPFNGLVEQAKIAIKKEFKRLRVRDIRADRVAYGTRSGDVFVTTWASVAANNKESRRVRNDGDTFLAIDTLIPMLREQGFKIAIVVDEAHHGFSAARESVKFYRDVMRPEFTLLITATPDDKDIEKFKIASGVQHLHTITVSRTDAVEAGLIKKGIRSVAYIANEQGTKQLIDFESAALSDAVAAQHKIKQGLKEAKIDLVPLMLVQVDSSDNSVEKAREKLIQLGVSKDSISSYTAKEPDADLVAIANDESKEVLIFKMAIALGFDAPRAFTLVSMRGSQNADFGLQIVGRILRVHRRLQGRQTPELLHFGYVFLADAENQAGLETAAQKINSIKTELATISPYTMVVNIAGQTQVQVVQNGQASMFQLQGSPESADRVWERIGEEQDGTSAISSTFFARQGTLLDFVMPSGEGRSKQGNPVRHEHLVTEKYPYQLRAGMPIRFQSERLPIGTNDLLNCIGAKIKFDEAILTAGMRESIKVIRKEEEIFSGDTKLESIAAKLSPIEVAKRARKLFDVDYLDPRELHETLLDRLKREFENHGLRGADDDDMLRKALNLIVVTYPEIISNAQRRCCAENIEVYETELLPNLIVSEIPLQSSKHNVYGVLPQGLNSWEVAFAKLLDADVTGTVLWWHRNLVRKPWSIAAVLSTGGHFFPDFVVGVNNRRKGGGILLVEVKNDIRRDDSIEKARVEHKIYGRVMMVSWENEKRWMTVHYNNDQNKNELDTAFDYKLLVNF
ncbi:MAG: DEAD/DEAH box helicase family protein [Acidobacteria bacterium]|nr:DEAD/DEAH box helicase family protein [Acidobacteriota bacterium]